MEFEVDTGKDVLWLEGSAGWLPASRYAGPCADIRTWFIPPLPPTGGGGAFRLKEKALLRGGLHYRGTAEPTQIGNGFEQTPGHSLWRRL